MSRTGVNEKMSAEHQLVAAVPHRRELEGHTFRWYLQRNNVGHSVCDGEELIFYSTADMRAAEQMWYNLTGNRNFK